MVLKIYDFIGAMFAFGGYAERHGVGARLIEGMALCRSRGRLSVTKVPVAGWNGLSRRIGGRCAIEINRAAYTDGGGRSSETGFNVGINFNPSGVAGGLAVFGDGTDIRTSHGHRAVRAARILVS